MHVYASNYISVYNAWIHRPRGNKGKNDGKEELNKAKNDGKEEINNAKNDGKEEADKAKNGGEEEAENVRKEQVNKAREFIQLLAVLASTITYQAGLDPPGGLWLESGEGHTVGDSILLTTHPIRYKAFFYSNSVAFVASLVIIIMLSVS